MNQCLEKPEINNLPYQIQERINKNLQQKEQKKYTKMDPFYYSKKGYLLYGCFY